MKINVNFNRPGLRFCYSVTVNNDFAFYRGFKQRLHAVIKAAQSCIPLLIVGVARTVSVKTTDYQEHVSEYGVHWNFFFTLIVVKVIFIEMSSNNKEYTVSVLQS